MRTLEINILSEDSEELIVNVLKAFEQNKLVTVTEKNAAWLPGRLFTEDEFSQLIDGARHSRTYSYEEAKSFLGL